MINYSLSKMGDLQSQQQSPLILSYAPSSCLNLFLICNTVNYGYSYSYSSHLFYSLLLFSTFIKHLSCILPFLLIILSKITKLLRIT